MKEKWSYGSFQNQDDAAKYAKDIRLKYKGRYVILANGKFEVLDMRGYYPEMRKRVVAAIPNTAITRYFLDHANEIPRGDEY